MLRKLLTTAALLALASCSTPVLAETGRASFYGYENGPRTASGEHFNPNGLTAAHRTRRLGSYVTVINLRNRRSVRVRINDRGPARRTGRVIDLSLGAAKVLGMLHAGVVGVEIR
jgi:rare lipoprotein A